MQANSAARQILPIATSNIAAGKSLFANAQDRDNFYRTIERYGSFSDTLQLVGRSGGTFVGALSGKLLEFDDGSLIFANIHDVDGLHGLVNELEGALGMERVLSHRQRRMLEVASHELRTPLAVIDSTAQRIVRSSYSADPQQIPELANRIQDFVGRASALLYHTIERVRGSIAELDFRAEPDRLERAITKVAMMFEESADIEFGQGIGDLPEIWFDTTLIEQVLVNLVENAVKYSTGRCRIIFSAKAGEHHVELLVRDWGIGILPDEREQVFTENARGRNVGSRPGTGFGLFIVDSIIRLHDGGVSVEDTDGPGTTIKVVLPIRPRVA